MTEPKKATDILIDLEKKLDVALNIIRAQDLNIKILSNKLNTLIEAMEKQAKAPRKITVEAVNTARPPTPMPPSFQQVPEADPERSIQVSAEFKLPMEAEPKGFRRTSRPETFAGDDSYLKQSSSDVKFPVQIPKVPPGRGGPNAPPPGRTVAAEIVVPSPPKVDAQSVPKQQMPRTNGHATQNVIPVSQRVVNSKGKSLYLAEVEIIDLSTMQPIAKMRTSANGKWTAPLEVGNYRVIIRRMDSETKERKETPQDIQVDGTVSPLELQTIIIQ